MAINLEFLQNLPLETQEDVLEDLSKVMASNPIEIDGKVYMIEEAVQDLIDSLYRQCEKYKTQLSVKN
jgi:coproporphyrinogen III oxidase-like Fe-S oxidoreductase